VIRLDRVTVDLRGRRIIDNATTTVPGGGVTLFTGENGAGKTTLIRAIAGLQRYSGSIRIYPRERTSARPPLYVCFDDAPVFGHISGYNNVRMLLGRSLRTNEIRDCAPAIADHGLLRLPARSLSLGQRKRLHILAALMSGAGCIILDEALSGVDAPGAREVAAALVATATTATVLVTSHGTDAAAELATHHLHLADGLITSGVLA